MQMDNPELTPKQNFDVLRQQYHEVFNNEAGEAVLKDLFKFCHMKQPAYVPNDEHGRQSAHLAGRQAAYMRIQTITKLTREEVFKDQEQAHV